MSAPLASLEQRLEIETPEQVAFSHTVAGLGSRAAAALVDYAACFAIMLALSWLVRLAVQLFGRDAAFTAEGGWLYALLLGGQFAVLWGWYVLWEGLRDGQTPGKRWVGLRVVQEGGYSVTFAASAVRNLVRIVDMQPGFFYVVGILSVALSRDGRRLGDLAAGTVVVRERAVELAPPVEETVDATGAAVAPARPLARLTDDEYALLERFVARRSTLEPQRRVALVEQLAARLRPRAPELTGSDAGVLVRLWEMERDARARGAASRDDTGARREQHLLVARGARRWRDFATRLDDARRRGLRALPEEEVSDLVSRYREIAADLARLDTASRGRETEAVYYVSRLVAGGHNLFYRQTPIAVRGVASYLAFTVPREIRRSWRPVLLAAVLLFAPMGRSWVAVARDPALAERFVGQEMIDRAATASSRERRGEQYLPQEMARLRGPAMASWLATNNIQVAFMAFAGGITAGVLTALSLFFNGVSLGAGLGIFQAYRVEHLIFGFIAAHGVLELSAICLAGGGGFLLAAGILLPGARTRRAAMVAQGRRALHLVAGATLLLVIAGLIEGNVSPLPWPNEAKYFIALVTALALALWVTRGRVRST